jgi:hypothetical protein
MAEFFNALLKIPQFWRNEIATTLGIVVIIVVVYKNKITRMSRFATSP